MGQALIDSFEKPFEKAEGLGPTLLWLASETWFFFLWLFLYKCGLYLAMAYIRKNTIHLSLVDVWLHIPTLNMWWEHTWTNCDLFSSLNMTFWWLSLQGICALFCLHFYLLIKNKNLNHRLLQILLQLLLVTSKHTLHSLAWQLFLTLKKICLGNRSGNHFLRHKGTKYQESLYLYLYIRNQTNRTEKPCRKMYWSMLQDLWQDLKNHVPRNSRDDFHLWLQSQSSPGSPSSRE